VGGAEALGMQIAKYLGRRHNIEVLTTTAEDVSNPLNVLPVGETTIDGVRVKRFKVNGREGSFNTINSKVLARKKITESEGIEWFRGNLSSDELCNYLLKNKEKFDFFIFMPYCFGITYFGSQIVPDKSIIVPCLHDEEQTRVPPLKRMFQKCRAIIFNSEEEKRFFERFFFYPTEWAVIGGILEKSNPHPKEFIRKYNLKNFIIYTGRKDQGKSTPLLLEYFCRYKENNKHDIKLVLTGPGEVQIPKKFKSDILDLGIIPKNDLQNAISASKLLCQPSIHESFSFSIMEAWLYGRPTLVHANCEVTKSFTTKANAGLYFENYEEFEECMNYLLENPAISKKLGENGRKFVLENYTPSKISIKYEEYLTALHKNPRSVHDSFNIPSDCPGYCKICYRNSDVFTSCIWKDVASSIPYVLKSEDRFIYLNIIFSLLKQYSRCAIRRAFTFPNTSRNQ